MNAAKTTVVVFDDLPFNVGCSLAEYVEWMSLVVSSPVDVIVPSNLEGKVDDDFHKHRAWIFDLYDHDPNKSDKMAVAKARAQWMRLAIVAYFQSAIFAGEDALHRFLYASGAGKDGEYTREGREPVEGLPLDYVGTGDQASADRDERAVKKTVFNPAEDAYVELKSLKAQFCGQRPIEKADV